jgi:tRNA dimethylallyltransferase
MTSVVALVGPTAVGKSSAAITIAQQYNGEIIGADSRQIYRYMDICTAKPKSEERQNVVHHLLDIIDPDELYSVAQYKAAADSIIIELYDKGKLALLVGGSGQYIWSVLENWQVPQIPPDMDFRAAMNKRAEQEGCQALYAELSEIDADSAHRIMPANVRRVIRALEIYHKTGRRPSELTLKKDTKYRFLILGLYSGRASLYQKINNRVDDMIKQGLVDEVKGLIRRGYHSGLPSMSGIGYRQISAYLEGNMLLEDAVNKIKYATHRFARSQYNWFRLADNRITWFDTDNDNREKILYTIRTFLAKD